MMDLFDGLARENAEHVLQTFLDWHGAGSRPDLDWLANDIRDYFRDPYSPAWDSFGAERAPGGRP